MAAEDTVVKGLIRHTLTFIAGALTVYAAKKGVAVPPEAVDSVVNGTTDIIIAAGAGTIGVVWSVLVKLKKKASDKIGIGI